MIERGIEIAFPPSLFRSPYGLSGAVHLGQGLDDVFDVGGLTRDVEDLLGRMPDDLLGTFQPRYEECLRKLDSGGATGLYSGGRCLYGLFQDMKDAMRDRESRPISTRQPSPSSGFPWIAVGIAGAAGLAALYFATR